MPFVSKAEIRKWGELVKQGKITQEKFDESMKATKDPHKLPERIGQQKIRFPRVRNAKVIK